MTQKIFRSVVSGALVVLLASFALIFGVLYQYSTSLAMRQLRIETSLAVRGVETEGLDYLKDFSPDGCRITWIGSDGSVLYESSSANAATMENHLEREEVKEAFDTGYGTSRRYSSTLMQNSLYAAEALPDGTVLRLSVSQDSALALLFGMAPPVAAILLGAIALSAFLASRFSKQVVKPLNDIDLDHPDRYEGYEELSPLLTRISLQQSQLKLQQNELKDKEDELSTILENMNEGMILIRKDGRILSINSAACSILGADPESAGRNILTASRNLPFQTAVSRALEGESDSEILELKGGSYRLTASPVVKDGEVEGAVTALFDVTDSVQAETLRREFSANVSHELKTPLHSISGYAELIRDGIAREEDVKPFAGKIYKEAQRTIHLVEDIISLSHLDEGAPGMEREETDLRMLAEDAVKDLEPEAADADVRISTEGKAAPLNGIPALLLTAVKNLIDNAVKYNRPGGYVKIRTGMRGRTAFITVTDNGIGIPEADQKRIFERFYRVDKSHSREVGGTGLGLSIVKHAVKIHGGTIDVKSRPGEGTSITLNFPA